MKLSHLPPRVITGAFILNSGLGKWRGSEEAAAATHGLARGTYPVLAKLPPPVFLRLLAAGEIALGGALILPLVPDRLAGAALTAFSASLLGLYARTPGMRKPGSVWPTQQGTGLSKDMWMLGIGLDLVLDR
ncbi:MAG: hypothetical protein ABR541_03085 [Candidatus Dormibacteria bacterium]